MVWATGSALLCDAGGDGVFFNAGRQATLFIVELAPPCPSRGVGYAGPIAAVAREGEFGIAFVPSKPSL